MINATFFSFQGVNVRKNLETLFRRTEEVYLVQLSSYLIYIFIGSTLFESRRFHGVDEQNVLISHKSRSLIQMKINLISLYFWEKHGRKTLVQVPGPGTQQTVVGPDHGHKMVVLSSRYRFYCVSATLIQQFMLLVTNLFCHGFRDQPHVAIRKKNLYFCRIIVLQSGATCSSRNDPGEMTNLISVHLKYISPSQTLLLVHDLDQRQSSVQCDNEFSKLKAHSSKRL